MSPSIQEQIDTLAQSITDLESSPSGVIAYITKYTMDQYDKSVNKTLAFYEEKAEDLNELIVAASGSLKILKMGIMVESA